MASKQKTTAAVLLILLFCNLGFIWGNSLVSRADSHDLSLNVLHILPGFLQSFIPGEASLLHLVRKAAHFTEFACLGGLSAGLLAVLHPQYSFAPAGMWGSTIRRWRRSSPSSWWTAEISIPSESMPIILRGGRFVMAIQVLPTRVSGS